MDTNRKAVLILAALLALACIHACSMTKPMTPQEVNDFYYGGYADSQDRRECVYEADKALASTGGASSDIYANIQRAQQKSDLIRQCMRIRGR